MTPDAGRRPPERRVLLVSSRGHSSTLPLRSALLGRGFRIFSLEAHDATSAPVGRLPADTQAIPFGGWTSLRPDLRFIAAFAEALRNIQPHVVQIDADRMVLSHTMTALLAHRQVPVLVHRGAIGGLNVLHPGDWLCFFGRRRQRLVCASNAIIDAYSRSPLLRRLLPRSRLEMLHHHVPDATGSLLVREQARQSLGIPGDCTVVGTICAVRPIKNIATVASAVHLLRRDFPRIRLAVIGSHGDGREIDRIKSLIDDELIALPGPRPNARDYLNAIDVFVSPTRAPGEGFGLAIAEAMLSRRAIVVSDVGAGRELFGTAGLTAPTLDVGAWRDAIGKLLRDPALRIALGEAARSRALELFCADTIADRSAAIYDGALMGSE